MTTPSARPRSSIGLAALTGLLFLVEGALAAIGLLVTSGYRRGNLTGSDAATLLLVGACAAVGMVVWLLVLVALARGSRGHTIAKAASVLGWLRFAGVIVTLVVIAVALGISAVAGLTETFGAVVAVLDALIGMFLASVSERRTRHG
ncbi:hypothetical protein [Actinoplanes sp. NPDC049681]|uniref:hypothetical protein n=1 Tax=Actinoplanes sp. NPDC049681 TaxID=3363905 RepID=UPI0037A02E45